jgi:hypothetical protein
MTKHLTVQELQTILPNLYAGKYLLDGNRPVPQDAKTHVTEWLHRAICESLRRYRLPKASVWNLWVTWTETVRETNLEGTIGNMHYHLSIEDNLRGNKKFNIDWEPIDLDDYFHEQRTI